MLVYLKSLMPADHSDSEVGHYVTWGVLCSPGSLPYLLNHIILASRPLEVDFCQVQALAFVGEEEEEGREGTLLWKSSMRFFKPILQRFLFFSAT